MSKLFLMVALAATLCGPAQAKVRLPHVIGDNMVIQSNAQARLWGWSKPGREVRVSVSWNDARYTVRAGRDGKWQLSVPTPEAGFKPLSITFDDGEPLTVGNVLSGEVWICAGQSNMEMPVRGFDNCPVEGYNDAVAEARNYPGVRHVKVPSQMSMRPLDDADCRWDECNAEGVQWASATGYFFARMLSGQLGVPVGLIEANKGGSRVESWLDADNLKKYTDERLDSASIFSIQTDYYRPLVWGNGTVAPIQNYTARGIVYYQGCSNVGYHTDQYARRLGILVDQWRRDFGRADMPFYFVEIAPYSYDDNDGTGAALLREQQQLASRQIANSGIVGTNDCAYPWEAYQIHPCQKRKVGERLAWLALTGTYGKKGFIAKSPSMESYKVDGSKIVVKVRDTEGGMCPIYGMEGFEIAGADRKFHKAEAHYDWRGSIEVSSKDVPQPVAVRYCFHNFALGNVRNQGGLPLLPFRTDSWDGQ